MTTRHHEKYKDKYLHLKRRMCRMRGGDEAIQKLLKDQLGRLQLLSPDPDEDGDALRVLQRISDKLTALLSIETYGVADVTAIDALRGRLDRVFQYRARTPTATTAHKELESSVSTTQDLIRRFVCRDQPAVRLPEDTTEAPPSPESVAPHSSDPSIVPPAVSTGEITVEEPAEDRLPEDEQTPSSSVNEMNE